MTGVVFSPSGFAFSLSGVACLPFLQKAVASARRSFFSEDGKELHLVQVQVIFRHGARSPITKLGIGPVGKYRVEWDVCDTETLKQVIDLEAEIYGGGTIGVNDVLEEGRGDGYCKKGQLSAVGAKQMSDLGQELRRRYIHEKGFLDDVLDLEKVSIRSTRWERAVNSALALMSGLWPANKRQGLNKIPLFVPEKHEEILLPNSKACARLKHIFEKARLEIEQDPDYIQIEREIEKLGPEALGYRQGDKNDYSPIMLRDFFAALEAHGKELPEVITSDLKCRVDEFATRYARELLYMKGQDTFDTKTLRLASGLLLYEVLSHLEKNRRQKLLVYSGHDATLIPLLVILDPSKTNMWPPFASFIIFEAYEPVNGSGEAYVRVLYNSEPLKIKNCPADGRPCRFSLFRSSLAKYMTANRQDECRMKGAVEPAS